jgi:ribose transport system substrate-binding protein
MNISVTARPVRPLVAVFGTCAMLLLAGCHNSASNNDTTPSGSGSSGSSGGSGQTQLAFVTNNPSDYWKICKVGVDAAAKKLGNVQVQFVEPADGTAATQKQDVDDLLAKGVKGIAISPKDPANETDYLNTVAAKTNLITSDSDAPNSNRLCYIGTDNHAAGIMAGELLKKTLPQGGKIMFFVGSADAQNAHDRITGVQDALKGSNIQVVGTRTDDSDHARAKQNAADAIVSNPDLVGMVGIWSYNGPAIYSAVKGAGKQGKIQIVAFDQEDDTMTGIKDGTIAGTIVQQPYQFGYASIMLLAQLAKGDKSGIPANKLDIIPTQVINKSNIAAYEASQAKLMGGS